MYNAAMGMGQDLYRKAKAYIPGGTQLLSKRPLKITLGDERPVEAGRGHLHRVAAFNHVRRLQRVADELVDLGAVLGGHPAHPVDEEPDDLLPPL